ncbi:MAG: thioesterase [Bacteroidetes bacterium]|nr:MAG: thioesterase [Bacteroidota bacterium]
MARIKLDLPDTFSFITTILVRIDDINYGNHLSNDAYLKYMHEARLRFFKQFNFTEMDLAGTSVIMGDAAIVFKSECFYGDELTIEVTAANFSKKSFDLFYRFKQANTGVLCCEAKTGIVCFDYNTRKTTDVPLGFKQLFQH